MHRSRNGGKGAESPYKADNSGSCFILHLQRDAGQRRGQTSLSWAAGRHISGEWFWHSRCIWLPRHGVAPPSPPKYTGTLGLCLALSVHLNRHMGRSSQRLQHSSCSHCWVWDAEKNTGTRGVEAAQPQHSPTTPSASLPTPG